MTSKFSNKTLKTWYSSSGLPSFFYPKSLENEKFSETFKSKVKSVLCPTIQESKSWVFYYTPTAKNIVTNETDFVFGFGYLCSRYIFDRGYCTYIHYSDLAKYLESKELTEKELSWMYADVVFVDGVKGLTCDTREADLFTSYLYKRITSNKKTVLCLLQDIPDSVMAPISFTLKNSVTLGEL